MSNQKGCSTRMVSAPSKVGRKDKTKASKTCSQKKKVNFLASLRRDELQGYYEVAIKLQETKQSFNNGKKQEISRKRVADSIMGKFHLPGMSQLPVIFGVRKSWD